jgi:hypothetical protein
MTTRPSLAGPRRHPPNGNACHVVRVNVYAPDLTAVARKTRCRDHADAAQADANLQHTLSSDAFGAGAQPREDSRCDE